MPRLDDIVTKINETIADEQFKDKRWQKGKFYGVAEKREKDSGDETDEYPAIVAQNGDATRIALDEKYPFWLYHRIEDTDVENFIDNEDFGEAKFVKVTYNMVLVLWGNRKKLQLRRDQVLAGLLSGFPAHLVRTDVAAWDLYGVDLTFTGANINAKEVYEQEFTTEKLALRSNHIMIAFEYDCAVTFRQGCFDVCDL